VTVENDSCTNLQKDSTVLNFRCIQQIFKDHAGLP